MRATPRLQVPEFVNSLPASTSDSFDALAAILVVLFVLAAFLPVASCKLQIEVFLGGNGDNSCTVAGQPFSLVFHRVQPESLAGRACPHSQHPKDAMVASALPGSLGHAEPLGGAEASLQLAHASKPQRAV